VFQVFLSTGFSFADFSHRFGFALRGDYKRSYPTTFGMIPMTRKLFTMQPCLCSTVPPHLVHQFPPTPRILRVPPRFPRLRLVIRSSSTNSSVPCRLPSHPPSAACPLPVHRPPHLQFLFQAPPVVPAPAPASVTALTPDSAEVHLVRLETELTELQKATVPEPKPDPAHVHITHLESKLEELHKLPVPSPVASSSVQSPPPTPHVINQTSSAFTVQESKVPKTPERVEKPRLQAAKIIEQVRQTPSYMLARGELAPRASTFMITEQS
jgi:hypothetical protein